MANYYLYHWTFPWEEYAVTSSDQVRKFLTPETATAGGFTVKKVSHAEYIAYKTKDTTKDLDKEKDNG